MFGNEIKEDGGPGMSKDRGLRMKEDAKNSLGRESRDSPFRGTVGPDEGSRPAERRENHDEAG